MSTHGKDYIEIIISPSSVPISFKGVYHYRSGCTKQELKGSALHHFLLKRIGHTWDNLPCEKASFDDIDNQALENFLRKASATKRIADDIRTDDTRIILENLDLLTEDGKLKNAAILIFGKRPLRFFPSVSFKIGRFIERLSQEMEN